MMNKEIFTQKEIEILSEKTGSIVKFNIQDENLSDENYECIGCSNADYGS